MNWEDTWRLCPTTPNGWRVNCCPECHKAQAKATWDIAFKAGQESIVESIPENLPPLLETAYRSGVKKVVDTYKRENPSLYEKYKAWWLIKGKEWGIA